MRDISVSMTRRPPGSRTTRAATSTRANGKQLPSARCTADADLGLEIMTITPELAQEWLDRGGTNRKITPPPHRGHDRGHPARCGNPPAKPSSLMLKVACATARIDCTPSFRPVSRFAP
jgi:hypothetical protein